jgi:hypothetical protein
MNNAGPDSDTQAQQSWQSPANQQYSGMGAQQPADQQQNSYANNGVPQAQGQADSYQSGAYPPQGYGYQQQNQYQQNQYQQGPYEQGPYAPAPGPYAMPGGNPNSTLSALAVAGLVVAIVALVFSWLLSFCNVLVFIGLGLSIAGIVATGVGKGKRGRGMAIAGTVVSVVALVASLAFGSMFIGAFTEGFEEAFNSQTDSSYSEETTDSDTVSSDAAIVAFDARQRGVVNVQDVYVGTTQSGEHVVAVVYRLKNTGSVKCSFIGLVMHTATQHKQELDENYDSDIDSLVSDKLSNKVDDFDDIDPGQEVTVVKGYTLQDSKQTVTISASGWDSDNSQTLSTDFRLS